MECHCHSSWSQGILITFTASAILVFLFAASYNAGLLFSTRTSDYSGNLSRIPNSTFRLLPSTLNSSIWPKASQGLSSNALRLDEITENKKKRKKRSASRVERELAAARAAIRRAASQGNASSSQVAGVQGQDAPLPAATAIYHNPSAFFQSYLEMEKRFKVYVYEEGEPPLVHDGPCKNIYTTEGRFIHELEMMKSGRRSPWTEDPARAHAFFLPFSVTAMVQFIYKAFSYDHTPFKHFIADYINVIASKHPYWNRTAGADHFMLSCHDWGPHASRANLYLYKNSIRALCNANTSEGFDPRKDVSIPEVYLYNGDIPRRLLGPHLPDLSERTYMAFFAGGLHGPIRALVLQHWKGRDVERFPVYEYLPKGLDYYSFMLKSRFCLCPSGFEVASPRIVEAIYSECVPVIISKDYVLPFRDVLRWEAFSVSVAVEDIPRLKEILEGVPEAELRRLREGVKAVKRHFVLNQPPKRLDAFHMILHSIWLRRLNIKLA